MADTIVALTNAKVKFRGQAEREKMPPVSQNLKSRAMFSAAEGKSTLGIPKKVGQEFTAGLGKGSVKKLPTRIGRKMAPLRARGLISDREAAKLEKKGT